MIIALKKAVRNYNFKKLFELSTKGALYFGSSAIGIIISFFTFPIFSHFLSEKDFAIFNYFNNLAGFFAFVFSLQFSNYFAAKYFRCSSEDQKKLTSSLVSFLVLWNTVMVCVVYGILIVYCNIINITLPYYPYLIFSVLITAVAIFKGFYLVQVRLDGNALRYFLINSSHKILGIGVGIALMYVLANNLIARFSGLLFAEVILMGVSLRFVFMGSSFSINRKMIKEAFKFIYPLIGASLIYFPITGMDQIYLERLNNSSELGYYTLGLTFASYMFMFNASVMQALEPDIIKCTIKGDYRQLFRIVGYFLLFCLVGTLCFVQISKYLIDFLTNGKFILSAGYCNVLVISFFFLIVFSLANTILISLKNSKAIFYINLVGCIISIGAYYILSKLSGFYGVAYGRTIVYLIMCIISIVYVYRGLKLNKEFPHDKYV